jgi:NAD(P)-dependent dehydrogenase (short-subunit alcohol dehydrogenase family)
MTIDTPADLPSFRLDGRVALITGGTRGLGWEIARAFAAAGASVIVSSRHEDACLDAAAALRDTGAEALGIACHVGHWDAVDRLAAAAEKWRGGVDVLVNNAGMAPLYHKLSDIGEDLWDKVIGVNLKGPFRLCALIGEAMKARGSGSIINVSSTGAVRPTHDIVPYAAAKAGLNAMTAGLAEALGPEVRVNCIMPGPFLTDISSHWDLDAFGASARTFPLRRGGQPHEICGAALYLAGDSSSFTTGATITVDGGAQWSQASTGDAARAPEGTTGDVAHNPEATTGDAARN